MHWLVSGRSLLFLCGMFTHACTTAVLSERFCTSKNNSKNNLGLVWDCPSLCASSETLDFQCVFIFRDLLGKKKMKMGGGEVVLILQDCFFYKRQMDAKVISTTVDSIFLAPSCFCDKIKTLPDPDYRMYHISYQDCDKNIACQFRMRYLSWNWEEFTVCTMSLLKLTCCLNVGVSASASIEHVLLVATTSDQDFGMHLLWTILYRRWCPCVLCWKSWFIVRDGVLILKSWTSL